MTQNFEQEQTNAMIERYCARIEKLENALRAIKRENTRAMRQFVSVSNKVITDACKVLDEAM